MTTSTTPATSKVPEKPKPLPVMPPSQGNIAYRDTSWRTGESRIPNARLVTVKLSCITQYSPVQTRAAFNPAVTEEDQALLTSLKQNGQLTPIKLEALKDKQPPEYRVIDGHRRIAALRLLNIEEIQAIVSPEGEQLKADLHTLIANVHQNLGPSELARQIVLIRERHNLTWEQIAEAAGLTRQHVHNLVKYTRLPRELQEQVEQKRLSLKAALALGQAPADQQPTLAQIAGQTDLSAPDATRLVEMVREGGMTPEQMTAELGLTATSKPDASTPAKSDTAPAPRKAAVGRRPNRAMSAKAAGALLKAYYPDAPAREIETVVQMLADQPISIKRLKLTGLLMLGGANEKQIPADVEALGGSRELLNLLEALAAMRRAVAQGKCAPEYLPAIHTIARWLNKAANKPSEKRPARKS
jgi:ParB/RepB/Spo0J family partition protein